MDFLCFPSGKKTCRNEARTGIDETVIIDDGEVEKNISLSVLASGMALISVQD